jgi:hypothetical protein
MISLFSQYASLRLAVVLVSCDIAKSVAPGVWATIHLLSCSLMPLTLTSDALSRSMSVSVF